MTRTRDRMLAEPGALLRRVFRDFDAWSEPRFPLAGLRSRTSAEALASMSPKLNWASAHVPRLIGWSGSPVRAWPR